MKKYILNAVLLSLTFLFFSVDASAQYRNDNVNVESAPKSMKAVSTHDLENDQDLIVKSSDQLTSEVQTPKVILYSKQKRNQVAKLKRKHKKKE